MKIMSVFRAIDHAITLVAQYVPAAILVLLAALINIQVFFRYVLHRSFGSTEEIPTYLMIWTVFLAAGYVAREDDHIRVQVILALWKNEKGIHIIKTLTNIIATVALSFFAYASFQFLLEGIRWKQRSPLLLIPMWWITSSLFIGGILMTVYYLAATIKNIKEMIQWK